MFLSIHFSAFKVISFGNYVMPLSKCFFSQRINILLKHISIKNICLLSAFSVITGNTGVVLKQVNKLHFKYFFV